MRYRIPTLLAVVLILSLGLISGAAAQTDDAAVVADGRTVAIRYTLTDDDGKVLDSNEGRDALTYVQGQGRILPALEEALAGMHAGDTRQVRLSPEEGYGTYRSEAVVEVPLDRLPEDSRKAGTMLAAQGPDGNTLPVQVKEIREDVAVMDWNHPLAGRHLNFDITVLSVE
jgi:FKBP-type peptidyl-prolyl cis-trans isomerase SlyD